VQLRRRGYLQNRELAYGGSGGKRLDAVAHTAGRTTPFDKRPLAVARSPVTGSVVLFAAIVALGLSARSSERAGVLLLLIAPIVVMSLAYQPRVGAYSATASLAAVVLAHQLQGGDLAPVAVASRAFAFYAIPLTIWLARRQAEPRPAVEAGDVVERAPKVPRDQPLTPREREVLGLVAAGHTNAQIADMLVLSVRTIESHRASLRRKLGRPSQPELVRYAQRWGLLSADTGSPHTEGVPAQDRVIPGLVY
jgi:DNA-binding CsgD family transcriptional regulator